MNTGVFASKYNFGISNSRYETDWGPIATCSKRKSAYLYVSLFSRKFWASKVMCRGSAADILVVLCKPWNPTANATEEDDYTHLDNFLRLSGM